MKFDVIIISLVFVFFYLTNFKIESKPNNPICSISHAGSTIDLSKLTLSQGQYIATDNGTGYWNFCFNFCALTSDNKCWQSTPAYFTVGDDEEDCYNLGSLNSMKIAPLDKNTFEKGVRLSYESKSWCGDKQYRGIAIDTHCDKRVDWVLVSADAYSNNSCLMLITARSKYACPFANAQ